MEGHHTGRHNAQSARIQVSETILKAINKRLLG
jgi:hypothetical protein